MTLTETAARIDAHLKRLAQSQDANDLIRTFGRSGLDPLAKRSGSRLMIRYVFLTRWESMTKAQAEEYLAALDTGFTGPHYKLPEARQ